MKNDILIYSYGVVKDLMKNNFQVTDIRPNDKMKGKTIYVFDNTKEIQDYLEVEHNITFG